MQEKNKFLKLCYSDLLELLRGNSKLSNAYHRVSVIWNLDLFLACQLHYNFNHKFVDCLKK